MYFVVLLHFITLTNLFDNGMLNQKHGGIDMSLISGCQEGKATPRLVEVKCPACGEYVEVFVKMGGEIGKIGTLVSDEICSCGFVMKAGTYEKDYVT